MTEKELGAEAWDCLSVITARSFGCTGAGIGIGYWLWKKKGMPWWVLLLFDELAGVWSQRFTGSIDDFAAKRSKDEYL